MYIIIPLAIILISALAMILVVWRKLPYLKKLPVDSVSVPEAGILESFFPEARRYLRKIDFSLYRELFFKELEKFLRRLRVVSLKLDRFSHQLIDKIHANGSTKANVEHLSASPVGGAKTAGGETALPAVLPVLSVEEKQKKEEYVLIVEIAKNPKNAELYKKLADLYILSENFSDAAEALETALKLDPEDKKTAAKLRAVQKSLPSR